MNSRYMLTIKVQNNAGVLARVASLFGRRGYNIDSLTVSATHDAGISRMTVAVTGDEDILEQIIHQTAKLEETLDVYVLPPGRSLYRELLLIKAEADEHSRRLIREICEIYGAQIVDLSLSTMVIELTGTPEKIDAFLDVMGQHPIVEICRTGATGLERGLPAGYRLVKEQAQ